MLFHKIYTGILVAGTKSVTGPHSLGETKTLVYLNPSGW